MILFQLSKNKDDEEIARNLDAQFKNTVQSKELLDGEYKRLSALTHKVDKHSDLYNNSRNLDFAIKIEKLKNSNLKNENYDISRQILSLSKNPGWYGKLIKDMSLTLDEINLKSSKVEEVIKSKFNIFT